MKRITFAALFIAVTAGSAIAGEAGIINQAGPYERTMQFYLHPAHGFPGTPEATQQSAPVADSEESEAKPAVASMAIADQSAIGAGSTQAAPPKSIATAAKQGSSAAPLTLYIEDSAGTRLRLLHAQGVGWKYVAGWKSAEDADNSMLVKTALPSRAPQSEEAPVPVEEPLTVFIDGPSGFTYVWIRDQGWKFVGRLAERSP